MLPYYSNVLTINVDISRQGDDWTSQVLLITPENKEGSEIKKGNNGNYYIVKSGVQLYSDFWPNVSKLKVNIISETHPLIKPKDIIHLDTFQVLQQLPIPCLNRLQIDLSGYYGKAEINFGKWNQYEAWKECQYLQQFHIVSSSIRPDIDITHLFGFDLEELSVPLLLTNEIVQFPNLLYLSAYGVYSNMTQQLTSLKCLKHVQEYQNRYDNSFENLHAERYYRSLVESVGGINFVQSSMDELITMCTGDVDTNFLGRAKRRADYLVYENEWPEYSGNTPENDTLFHVRMRNHKFQGVLTYKLKDQYPRNDREKHHIDFDHLPHLKFPENGHWLLKYANGNAAIEGDFENNRKNGDWFYYNENGDLRSTKNYRNDTLLFSKVQFNLHGNTLESRTYYVSEDEVYQSIFLPDENKVRLNVIYYDGFGMPYRFSEYGVVEFRERNRMYAQTYVPGSKKYNKVIREGIIDKLFPEFVGQELPFTVGQ